MPDPQSILQETQEEFLANQRQRREMIDSLMGGMAQSQPQRDPRDVVRQRMSGVNPAKEFLQNLLIGFGNQARSPDQRAPNIREQFLLEEQQRQQQAAQGQQANRDTILKLLGQSSNTNSAVAGGIHRVETTGIASDAKLGVAGIKADVALSVAELQAEVEGMKDETRRKEIEARAATGEAKIKADKDLKAAKAREADANARLREAKAKTESAPKQDGGGSALQFKSMGRPLISEGQKGKIFTKEGAKNLRAGDDVLEIQMAMLRGLKPVSDENIDDMFSFAISLSADDDGWMKVAAQTGMMNPAVKERVESLIQNYNKLVLTRTRQFTGAQATDAERKFIKSTIPRLWLGSDSEDSNITNAERFMISMKTAEYMGRILQLRAAHGIVAAPGDAFVNIGQEYANRLMATAAAKSGTHRFDANTLRDDEIEASLLMGLARQGQTREDLENFFPEPNQRALDDIFG